MANEYELFTPETQAIVYGMQNDAIQRMLDFDFICRRKTPSVAAIINPTEAGYHKAFFGAKEIIIPIYKTIPEAVSARPKATVLVNFASFRSAYETSMEALKTSAIKTIVIIAEGVPERRARELIAESKKREKVIIGPATVGGIAAGAFRIGNTGGDIDNIINSKLHRPGSVGFVSKSGGMSNEMFNVIAMNANGICEGIAIGGDRYPGSSMIEHIMRYEKNPNIKFMVALGELGGEDEYEITKALSEKRITKPLIIWVTGTCAKMFQSEVQFGHAGAKSGKEKESADSKNKALKDAGAIVPASYDDFGETIKKVYNELKSKGIITENEVEPPKLPLDYNKAIASGSIRKSTNFISTISDDRGDEVTYAGIPISKIIDEKYSLGDVISLLWFRKRLPSHATKFIELVLMITADHGPAVSGAHNAIITARAGKDLVSSLCSGLLTIGPRFGGAIDDAARYFRQAHDSGISPEHFVDDMKKKGKLIPGIGHRVKSLQNPDKRVELLKEFAKKNFPKTQYLEYALEVEKITTSKRANLILNVDGCIGVLFLDLFASCGEFSKDETDQILEIGVLNGLFALGRSIGMIGHYLDQKRLKAPLYRHPYDDILYID